jgi:transposase
MAMVADVVDVVVGGDTHKDTHALEMLSPVGATLARLSIANDEDGFAEAVAWIAEHAAGARLLIGLEGTRCYGIGLVRALTRTGLTVVEVERPKREQRRGRGKSDPIDAHLAGLAVLRMDADRLPTHTRGRGPGGVTDLAGRAPRTRRHADPADQPAQGAAAHRR